MQRVLFIQTGDFGEACRRMDCGQEETYHEQFKSVGFVRKLSETREIIVASISDTPGEVSISANLTALGIDKRQFFSMALGAELEARYRPDSLIVRLPHAGVIQAAERRALPCFPCLADVFASVATADLLTRHGLRQLWLNRQMRRLFAHPNVVAVGNHSLSASRSVHTVLGVSADKITPWEWSKLSVVETPKTHPRGTRPLTVFYVGTLSEEKGVGDLLTAFLALERDRPGRLHLTLAGAGPLLERIRHVAEGTEAKGRLTVLGPVPKKRVREIMAATDVVVVPSRPSYAEGLPNAIVEGMAYRASLVIAEHPSTRDRLEHGRTCLISRALDTNDLARQIRRLDEDPELFHRLSENANAAYHSLFFGSPWYDLIQAFVDDPRNETGWVRRHSLASLERPRDPVP